jgi:hypothetical protein
MHLKKLLSRPALAGLCAFGAAIAVASAANAQAVAITPYTLTTFNGVPPAGASHPDDLAISADGTDLWVAYGNGNAPDGSDGKSSNVVEYDIATGAVLKNVIIPGHSDGLKINPLTGGVWVIQNEDANPMLAIINSRTGTFKTSTFVSPLAHGGGFDDLVFGGTNAKEIFLSASNPSGPPFTSQAIVEVGHPQKILKVSEVLAGDATAFNVVTGQNETLALSDPDSMTLDPAGELVLDSQADQEIIVVRSAVAAHPVLKIPLTLDGTSVEVNDTIFPTSTAGTLFISDRNGEAIYELTKPYFPPNEVYTAADANNTVGLLDMNTGVITPVVTGLVNPEGMAFLPSPAGLVAVPR